MKITKPHALILSVCAVLLTARCNVQTPPVQSGNGAVSSAHPLATQAGLDVLKSGGTAFDAAIAVAATLNVVEPMMSGIGGYGTILIYDAKNKHTRFLNASGRIPVLTNSDLMRPPTVDYLQNRIGAKSISTPGNLHAWEALHKLYGNMPWNLLLTDAIWIAENGFAVTPRLEGFIADSFLDFSEYTKSFYTKDGIPLKTGDTLYQKDLANTFKQIAMYGAGEFYQGDIALKIDQSVRNKDGFLSKADLEADSAEWYEPTHYIYKGYKVYTASPPANSFAALISLGIMQSIQNKIEFQSPAYFHLFAEITKHSYASRLKYSFDPEIQPSTLGKVLSDSFFVELGNSISPERASSFNPFPERESKNTTHFVVVDKWGNVVSATQTLGNVFGSRIMPEGTGVWLNNSLAYCTYEPKGNPMDAYPGRHKFSGDCPVIIMKDDQPWAALGSPGGHTITQNVPQIIFNLIDGNMTMKDAINAPKIAFTEPDSLSVEEGIPITVRSYLEERGHKLRSAAIGNAHGVKIIRDTNGVVIGYEAAADRRGEGVAIVLQ
jgi:gamma-glutamyltranspeptidase/glutathione hydrolase